MMSHRSGYIASTKFGITDASLQSEGQSVIDHQWEDSDQTMVRHTVTTVSGDSTGSSRVAPQK